MTKEEAFEKIWETKGDIKDLINHYPGVDGGPRAFFYMGWDACEKARWEKNYAFLLKEKDTE